MRAHDKHVAMIISVAKSLGDLCDDCVFVGGSSVGFLITDGAAPDVRPTIDVDIVIAVQSRYEYHKIEEALRQKGFKQDVDVICRWKIGDNLVDVMPDDEKILGFSCKWYSEAMKKSSIQLLDQDISVNMITAPYLIATKIEAYYGRGKGDLLMSHDIEDIIFVINGRQTIVEEIGSAGRKICKYLKKEFKGFFKNELFHESVSWTLPTDAESQRRQEIIMGRVKAISELPC